MADSSLVGPTDPFVVAFSFLGDEENVCRTNFRAQKYIPNSAHNRKIIRASLNSPDNAPNFFDSASARAAVPAAPAPTPAAAALGDAAADANNTVVPRGRVLTRAIHSRADRCRADRDSAASAAEPNLEV